MKKLNAIFVLALTVIKRVIAVLDIPSDIDDAITFAKSVHASMVAGIAYAALAAKLTALNTAIGKLVTSQTGFNSTPPSHTKAQRDADLVIVKNLLRGLQGDVQVLADADVANAEALITGAGMKVKKAGEINKQDLELKDGPVSGSVKLVAKGADEQRSAHDWAYSVDEGAHWVNMTPTIAASTLIEGLQPGTKIKVQHRYIFKDGPTDFIVSDSFLVR